MRKLFLVTGFIFNLLIVIGCGGGGNSGNDTQPITPADLSGAWNGIYSSNILGTTIINFNIVQAGANISGTFIASNGATGSIAGILTGNIVDFAITQTNPTCKGSFSGAGTVADNSFNFTFSGTACDGQHNGSGLVLRENGSQTKQWDMLYTQALGTATVHITLDLTNREMTMYIVGISDGPVLSCGHWVISQGQNLFDATEGTWTVFYGTGAISRVVPAFPVAFDLNSPITMSCKDGSYVNQQVWQLP